MPLSLSSCLRKQSLVSIRRRDVDNYGIQGFVIGFSESLLALEYVYDFQIDGIIVMRRADITEVRRTATDQFQEALLREEGVRPGQQAAPSLKPDGWQSLIEELSQRYAYMILERELGPDPAFAIGRAVRATAAQVEFQAFSGTGRWYPKTERLKYSQLTCAQVNTRYLRFYQRHFERGAA